MTKLHRFNEKGIERFRDELRRCREMPAERLDRSLLENPELTDYVSGVELTLRNFATKGEAGNYFKSVFAQTELTPQCLMSDAGLWTWLSLFYFDSICPREPAGKISLKKDDCYYIFEPKNSYKFYRHLLFISWRIIDAAKNNPHRIMSTTNVNELDRVTFPVMSRLFLLRIPCLFEVLDKIYWDEKQDQVRRGVVSEYKPGNLFKRFPTVIQQLSLTYDLQELDAEHLIKLLGEEFHF
jgi:hypothetical protein